MSPQDELKFKLKECRSYWQSIVGQRFEVIEENLYTEEGMSEMIRTRNQMAKVLIFQGLWKNFSAYMHSLDKDAELTQKESDGIFIQVEFMYEIWNGSEDFWASFWRGEQPMHPEKSPFTVVNEDGTSKTIEIDLNNVKNITIL